MSTTTLDTILPSSTVVRIIRPAEWERRLSGIFWVNSVAISSDGSRVFAASFAHDYMQRVGRFLPNIQSRFGTYCFDSLGNRLWSDEYDGWDGVFGVAISGDGQVAAAGGWIDRIPNPPNPPTVRALLRAYNAADGQPLLDYRGIDQRVSCVALSGDGTVLAAAADNVYIFLRSGTSFNPTPLQLGASGTANRYMTSVAVHPNGTWLAACDHVGHVYMATIVSGAIGKLFQWPANPALPTPFLSVAISPNSDYFAAGGGNFVYLFDFAAIRGGSPIAPLVCDTTDPDTPLPKPNGQPQENVRWVAISGDGNLVTAAANRVDKATGLGTGLLLALDGQLNTRWRARIERNPNSTSIDAAGQYATLCDGYPTGKPADFRLFDANNGQELWHLGTHNMNWPMVISANGAGIAAGSDDGAVYYFRP